ncbi:hypothetical protein, partial [Gordonia aichiensis]
MRTDARRATPADSDLDPGFFDADAQQSVAWLAWSDPAAIDARIERLFTETLPGLEAVRGTEGRPSLDDRFSVAAFDWITAQIEFAVRGEDGQYAPENDHLADQFITYIGEWMVRRVEGVWFNSPGNGAPIFDQYGPAVGYRWSPESTNDLVALLFMMAVNSDDSPYAYFVAVLDGLRNGYDRNLRIGFDDHRGIDRCQDANRLDPRVLLCDIVIAPGAAGEEATEIVQTAAMFGLERNQPLRRFEAGAQFVQLAPGERGGGGDLLA